MTALVRNIGTALAVKPPIHANATAE